MAKGRSSPVALTLDTKRTKDNKWQTQANVFLRINIFYKNDYFFGDEVELGFQSQNVFKTSSHLTQLTKSLLSACLPKSSEKFYCFLAVFGSNAPYYHPKLCSWRKLNFRHFRASTFIKKTL